MPAPPEIRQLVERFEANLDSYRNSAYNETLLRRDFLDPMFKALGWDVDNSQGYAEAFREVVHEDAIKIGGAAKETWKISVRCPNPSTKLPEATAYQLPQARFSQNDGQTFDYRLSEDAGRLVQRIMGRSKQIDEEFVVGVGINTGFIRDSLVSDKKKDGRFHPMVAGDGISRYGAAKTSGWIMYDRDYVRSQGTLGRSLPPEDLFVNDKILVVRTRNLSLKKRIVATLDRNRSYNLNRLSNIVSKGKASVAGLLGVLNSKFFDWLFSTRFYDYEIKPVYLKVAPLCDVNNEKLIGNVERMLKLNDGLAAAKTAHDKTLLERQIVATDRQIDALVYELYGLTKDEIAIVEGIG